MSIDKLRNICQEALDNLGLSKDQRYVKRLKWELSEIEIKSKWDYFINLIGKKYAKNFNNLLVVYLLKIADDYDIEKDPLCEYGEYPDIDVDYLSEVRDYLKNEWAPKIFGEDYVCNIGNYTTFSIKNSLLDMARVHGVPREEIQELTKNLEAKDDEGKALTWDSAMKLYPELKKYCEKYPEIADSACRMLHRNRGMGQHAGGLIISSIPLHDLVPLTKRKDSPQASSWVEGLHGQDLQPVGLVKFDLLVISNLLQIFRCCDLVKKRHNLSSICGLPNQSDWTDVDKWRNDPKSLAMANEGDLKCIFQFDSDGIRKMVCSGGVTRFEDLVAYTSLYRPGPLNCKMQERYIQRKKGQESYYLHPLVKPILEKTYGVMIYQEDVMKILNVVGEIPLKDCEVVRKAISKKKEEAFKKYEDMFIVNGIKNLNTSIDEVKNLWNQIKSFSEYGFNLSMTGDTLIPISLNEKIYYKRMKDFVGGEKVYCINQDGETVETKVVALHNHGELDAFEAFFDDGKSEVCTPNHRFLTDKGMVSLKEICRTGSYILSDQNIGSLYAKDENRCIEESIQVSLRYEKKVEIACEELCEMQTIDEIRNLSLGADYAPIFNTRNLVRRKIVRIVPVGKRQMFDLEVANVTHNFVLASGIVSGNSHAMAYTYISGRLLYLKAHYPHEFYAAVLSCEKTSDKIKEYKIEAKCHNVDLVGLDINKSKITFELVGDKIYFGFSNVKGIGKNPAQEIVKNQPYTSFEDFLYRFGTDANILKPLIGLRCFKDADPVVLWKFVEYYREQTRKYDDKIKRYAKSISKYDDNFRVICPDESITLHELTGQQPFDNEYWKNKYNFDEYIDVEKEMRCLPEDPGAYQKIEIECIEKNGIIIEQEVNRYYHIGIVKRKRNRWKELRKLWNCRQKLIEKNKNIGPQVFPKLVDFDPSLWPIQKSLLEELRNVTECERKYYGFPWVHDLEKSPDYNPNNTFDNLKQNSDSICPVEVKILSVKRTESKAKNSDGKPKTIFYRMTVEDVRSEVNVVNIWKDDYDRWSEILKDGNLVRLRLQAPEPPYNTYTLENNRGSKPWIKKYPDKENDFRVYLMKYPVENIEKYQTEDDTFEQLEEYFIGSKHE